MTTGAPSAPGRERIGVVLAGAGARGAYEAGVLSVLLPVLERTGRRPTVLVGTSAGALNVAFLASVAHLPAEQAADAVVERWVTTRRQDVIGPVAASALVSGIRYGLDVLGTRVRVTGLLDTAPLRRTVETGVDWDQLNRNVGPDGPLEALAVAATALSDGRTKLFVGGPAGEPLPASDLVRPIDYLRATFGPEHVLASSAIPVAFPATLVEQPAAGQGWYTDGGVRLNVPIKPAIMLGCDRIVVVATTPDVDQPPAVPPGEPGRQPDIFAAANQSLQSLLSDRMVEDLATLAMVNRLVAAGATDPDPAHPYRLIPYVFGGPSDRQALGRVAAAVFDEVYASPLRRLLEPDIPLISRALGGSGPDRDDLLSFLFFEPEFLQAAVDLGRADATALLATAGPDDPIPWRTEAPATAEPSQSHDSEPSLTRPGPRHQAGPRRDRVGHHRLTPEADPCGRTRPHRRGR